MLLSGAASATILAASRLRRARSSQGSPSACAPCTRSMLLVGARSLAQLDDNLGVLDVRLDPAQQAGLAGLSAIELGFPTVPCAASTSPDKRAQHDAASASELATSDSRPAAN